jgi:hypothetical protein
MVNITLEERMQNVEDELKQLRKEMEESIARYKTVENDEKMPYYPFTHGDVSKFRSGQIGDTKCLWDSIPVEDRMKPMGLSCPCRKCSAYC